jgi:cytochrome c553
METIESYAKQIESKHAIFIFDSCFSGSFFKMRAAPELIAMKTTQPVRQFITSGGADQQVPDISLFRKQFIAAINGEGDTNKDGYLTGSELGSFLEEKVTNYSKGTQTPQYGKIRDPALDKGDFVFVLTTPQRNISTPSIGTSLSTGLDDLVQEDNNRRSWNTWQENMSIDFDKVSSFNGSPDLLVTAWQRFINNWQQENPLSDTDNQLRSQAANKLTHAIESKKQLESKKATNPKTIPSQHIAILDRQTQSIRKSNVDIQQQEEEFKVISKSISENAPVDYSRQKGIIINNSRTGFLSTNCSVCHGPNGMSHGAIPSLAGLEEKYFIGQMKAFRDGSRPSTVMQKFATGFTDEEISSLGKHFQSIR